MITEFKLPGKWQQRWDEQGFSEPSIIQETVYGPLVEGENLVGISPTGSGKTLAYLLPTMQNVTPDEGNQLLILTSSQELGIQVAEVARQWGKDLGLNVQPFIGGANVKRQIEKLKTKPEVLIGTPGRIVELIKQKKIKSHQLKTIIFDEADQLFLPGASHLVEEIVRSLQQEVQFGFFSATADQALPAIQAIQPDIQVFDVTKEDRSKGVVKHTYLIYPSRRLVDGLRRLAHIEAFQGLVFFNQLQDLGSAEEKLLFHHLRVASLASDQSKELRKMALELFKQGKIVELLTTDVASRGLDITGLPYVINAEVPLTKESYLHRAGRVGRMGASGQVVTIVQENTLPRLKKLAKELDLPLTEVFLHGGALLDEQPEKEVHQPKERKPLKEKTETRAKQTPVKAKPKVKNRKKAQKNKGARKSKK
ncbi:DEAD/DEAH box helicase [Enterococcus saccharolyticus]|uniref:DEAD/DEAH box helicase n=1 Tax=Enterococcus saccharolyticus TaxID=41997 RepID=UPI0039DFD465